MRKKATKPPMRTAPIPPITPPTIAPTGVEFFLFPFPLSLPKLFVCTGLDGPGELVCELVLVEEEDVEVAVTFSGLSVVQVMRVSRVHHIRWKGESLTSHTPRKSEIKPIRSLQVKNPSVSQSVHSILYHKTTRTHRHELISPRGHGSPRRDGERVPVSKRRLSALTSFAVKRKTSREERRLTVHPAQSWCNLRQSPSRDRWWRPGTLHRHLKGRTSVSVEQASDDGETHYRGYT
jgi:hypothetical protein